MWIMRRETVALHVNVKDAVQLDGASSVLLGVENNIVVGRAMNPVKTEGNTWGYKFMSG